MLNPGFTAIRDWPGGRRACMVGTGRPISEALSIRVQVQRIIPSNPRPQPCTYHLILYCQSDEHCAWTDRDPFLERFGSYLDHHRWPRLRPRYGFFRGGAAANYHL